jgi:hypothetical protein
MQVTIWDKHRPFNISKVRSGPKNKTWWQNIAAQVRGIHDEEVEIMMLSCWFVDSEDLVLPRSSVYSLFVSLIVLTT